MKVKSLLYIIICIQVFASACKKQAYNNDVSGVASLTVSLAITDVSAIAVNLTPNPIPFYQNQMYLFNGSSATYGLSPGTNPLSIVNCNDTSKILFSSDLSLARGSIYSLFLCGQSSSVDTVLTKDSIPVYPDSAAGIRIANLVPDSKQPISINIAGNSPSQIEFRDLYYKQVTLFRKYPATSVVGGSYNFEIRDQVSGNLLQTINWKYNIGRNNTLVISGFENNKSVYCFIVNDY